MSDPYGSPEPLTPEELALLPHDNSAPQLLASIWALAGIATLFLCLRMYCRLLRRRIMWWDDAILIASWVSSLRPHTNCWIQGVADMRT
jgi:hypothetical protein